MVILYLCGKKGKQFNLYDVQLFFAFLLFSQINKSIVIVSKIINIYDIAISRIKVSQKQFHLNT